MLLGCSVSMETEDSNCSRHISWNGNHTFIIIIIIIIIIVVVVVVVVAGVFA